MKSHILAITLFTLTALSVAVYPAWKPDATINPIPVAAPVLPVTPINTAPVTAQPAVDVVFVLDTTGSMGGLLQAAKEKIWSIASTMAAAQPAPTIRIGLVAYRDRGDDYVTRVVDLSEDLDSVYATLMEFSAAGGGDGPESVNRGLYDAIHHMSWNQNEQSYKAVFLVGDAPPHMDYQDDVKYPVTLALAKERGIVVNTIQCGNYDSTRPQWNRIAQLGNGRFFQVEQAGSAVVMATPYDEKLAALSASLDETRMFYGTVAEKDKMQKKVEATDKLHAFSSLESRARRATFNASAPGKNNLLGDKELVEDVASGRVEVGKLDQAQLPASLQGMPSAEQEAVLAEVARKRSELQRQIKDLSDQRGDYMKQKMEAAGGAEESLDNKIFSAVREQAAEVGLHYDDDAVSY